MYGKSFREKREAAGLTQQAMAEKLLISQPRLAQIEAEIKPPSLALLKLAAEVLDCTTDALIFGEERGA